MIALDTSAVVAIALEEEEEEAYADEIAISGAVIGIPTLFECRLVLTSKMPESADRFMQRFIERPSVHPTDFTLEMYEAASSAFERFGRGRGHPAQLNFGDCLAYAVAKTRSLPLLFKGEDLARTDIQAALR